MQRVSEVILRIGAAFIRLQYRFICLYGLFQSIKSIERPRQYEPRFEILRQCYQHLPCEVIRGSGGKPVAIEFQRNGKPMQVTVQPVWSTTDGPARWMIGAIVEPKLNIVTSRLSLPDALRESVQENVRSAGLIFRFLEGIVERRISAKSLTGPVGIAQMSGQAAKQGPVAFIMLMSMVSLNLAVINLMPLPILDGGSVVMLIIEMVMRRDMSMSVKEAVFKVGFVFIMMLVAFVLYNDITKILPAG